MHDILILGGGPAGLTAAIYATRACRDTLVIAEQVGGAASIAHRIDNYSALPKINGYDLTAKMYDQSVSLGAKHKSDKIVKITASGSTKVVETESGIFEGRSLILALGSRYRKIGLDGEDELLGSGISYCATCDGNFFKRRTVAVVGGGDTALSDALFLSKIATKVILIHRRNEFRASASLVSALQNSGVEVVYDSIVEKLQGNPLSAIIVRNLKTGCVINYQIDGLFVAIGSDPCVDLIKEEIALTDSKYIITDRHMRTNIPGVYAAGDIRDTPLRQIITACADGAIAAETASSDLK
ncbi:MAG: FAD-dependent oxidoreductase [Christensenellaceae bacterium]|jgi:thioredoxin reductase (NADPH)|nr:FAD-dependent oxidoreductase [Christensenellaceae bacterium]